MAIQTIRAVRSANGTMNINTLATESVSAESRIQGRALPARVRVRSISWPTTRLAATIKIVERSCRVVKKPRSSFSTLVR